MPSITRLILLMTMSLFFSACGGSSSSSSDPVAAVRGDASLRVLSNRPDLISANDVLVEVTLASAEFADELVMELNGDDVTAVLEPTADNPLRLLGRVEGLLIGDNELSLNIGNSVELVNHPSGGPVFTGPHIQPWVCGNANAVDEQCNQPAEYEYFYVSQGGDGTLQSYDPDNPPGDVATTTVDGGEEVPFVVRREAGFQARDQYWIFTLFKPDEPWSPANPQSQWNRLLMVPHGGNCRGHHTTQAPNTDDYAGTVPGNAAIPQSYMTALSRGWAVMGVSQLDLGHNCNLSYQAEALMMAKERFVEQYGELRYTVGSGCSGGAITQNMIANAYPGLYQGLLTTCTYPDVMSTATQFFDYHILLRYLNDPSRQNGQSFVAVEGDIFDHPQGRVNATAADTALFSEAVNPESACLGVSESERFHEENNPTGVRCDVLTFMQNMLDQRPQFRDDGREQWNQLERDQNEGYTGFPLGNQGVQYGLVALQEGLLTPAQFLELNTGIGGIDLNLNVTGERTEPSTPTLANAYRTGILNTIVNMDTVPIINMTGPDPGAAHDSVHGYWVRWRFDREFGHHDNHVMWGGPTALIGDQNYMNMSLLAMQRWLDSIESDASDRPLAEKVIDLKPDDIHDQCSDGNGNFISDEMCSEEQMLVYGTPRTAAGDDIYGDSIQCVLRPFSRSDDYGFANDGLPAPFPDWSEDDWQRLEAAFTATVDGVTGPFVCDYSQKPKDWQPTITWLRYQDDLGIAIPGGEQMKPADFPAGWASPAFRNTWEPKWLP